MFSGKIRFRIRGDGLGKNNNNIYELLFQEKGHKSFPFIVQLLSTEGEGPEIPGIVDG